VLSELIVMEVVVGADGGLLDGAVHAFDLAVGPRMAGLGQAVVDGVVAQASSKEWARKTSPRCRARMMSLAAERELPGVVKWVLLSVRTVWIL
jgi:hypothetical protein